MPYADLTDMRCYYELRGEGELLLLIPGLGSTCRVWDGFADDIAGHVTMLTADNRGIGQSRAKRPAHSLRDYSADLLELLDHLQVERAHVLGLSLGGMIAQWFAIEHPDRVDRLVLMSTAHRLTPYLSEMTQMLGQALYRLPRRLFERTMELLECGPAMVDADPGWLDRKIERGLRQAPPAKEIIRQLRCAGISVPAAEDYRITAPTLIISGEYDALIPHCYGERMAQLIAGSRYLLLRGCGHNLINERPREVAALTTAFLRTGDVPSDAQPSSAGPVAAPA